MFPILVHYRLLAIGYRLCAKRGASTLVKTSCRAISLLLALALGNGFSVFSLAGSALADELPTFGDPAVNSFVKTYSQFVDSYVDAAKTGDASKLATVQAKEAEIQQQFTLAIGKLRPEEAEKFQPFLARSKDKIKPYYRYSVADVNTFVTKYTHFVDSYVEAAKKGDASKLAGAKAKEEREFQQLAVQAAGKLKKDEGKLLQEDKLFQEFLTTYTQKIAAYVALTYKYIDENDIDKDHRNTNVNTFVEKYAKFADDYIAALQAANTGDTSKLTNIQSQATELQAEVVPAVNKLKPGEAAIFQSFIAQEIAKIDAAK
jgi:hypothetical protein